jgi:hypothetical protein
VTTVPPAPAAPGSGRGGGFSYAFEAGGTLARAVELLGDPTRTAELHPSITRVDRIDPVPGAAESYRMVDSTRLGPFALALEYRVDVIAREAEDGWARITTHARQAPGIRFWNETLLVQSGATVRGLVGITLSTPPGIGRWALEGMRRRHDEVRARIVETLERGSGR